jgi:type I restriction enzyme R subunit
MVGRGTRLCKDLLGSGKDKTHFQVFDHWGVVEYHGLEQRDVVISQSKPRMQRLFETRIELAKLALEQHEAEVFETMAEWMGSTINSLEDKTIAVKEKWRERAQVSDVNVIKQFDATTVVVLQAEIAPLMKWVDIRGNADAYEFDLLISQLQLARLRGSAQFVDLLGKLLDWINDLQLSLNQVKSRETLIKQVREVDFWQQATVMDIEQVRLDLRDIMRFRAKKQPTPSAPIIDIEDSGVILEEQSSYLHAVDLQAYMAKVEQALNELFETDPVLKKIRAGNPITEKELDQLNALVHTNHPDVDLKVLKSFYGTAAPMDQVLRSIVGMEADTVNASFAGFIQAHPGLSARQTQFLGMLKRQIQKAGAVEVDQLYQRPFSALGELDELFSDENQITELMNILKGFGETVLPESTNGLNIEH